MIRLLAVFIGITVLLLAAPGAGVDASNPGTPQPLLGCADVNGDGPVGISDITQVVRNFGTFSPNADYFPLYDVQGGDGSVGVADIGIAVLDFGLTCPLVDTEIAQATLAILNHPERDQFLNENPTFLATQGYFRGSSDVPGQGVHYVNETYFYDDLFTPTQPEGLVYSGGKLVAQLYFIDGNTVGWGCWPGPYPTNCSANPPEDQVEIDSPPPHCAPACPPVCTPLEGEEACSWDGPEDGWHWHSNLCTVAIGTPSAFAIPGVSSRTNCQNLHEGWCGGKCLLPDGSESGWRWHARVGWMGHLWNHEQVNPNGRFADCAPEPPTNWKAFNCPQ